MHRGRSGLAGQSGVGGDLLAVVRRAGAGPPPLHLDQAGCEEVQAVEEPADLVMAAQRRRPGRAGIDPADRLGDPLPVDAAPCYSPVHEPTGGAVQTQLINYRLLTREWRCREVAATLTVNRK